MHTRIVVHFGLCHIALLFVLEEEICKFIQFFRIGLPHRFA